MRLLNVQTFKLESFVSSENVKYAILSHTWDKEEITYEDMTTGDEEKVRQKLGMSKVWNACRIALKHRLRYIWIDTCCIDKSSSAELSEDINSMFRYYEDSQICIAFLQDVEFERAQFEAIQRSRWFSRGWTLQELIAPNDIEFYDFSWKFIGTKETLSALLVKTTGVDEDVLRRSFLGHNPLPDKSIAKRMSWAAMRETTREEDTSYCLLGLFNVAMPLLYGEGRTKAFTRLQLEIMKESTDMSIFAWTRWKKSSTQRPGHVRSGAVSMNLEVFNAWARRRKDKVQQNYQISRERGVLAIHPRDFLYTATVVPLPSFREPYSVTNSGLQIRLPIWNDRGGQMWAILDCRDQHGYRGPLAIPLENAGTYDDNDNQSFYARKVDDPPKTIQESIARDAEIRTIHILNNFVYRTPNSHIPKHVWVRQKPRWRVVEAFPREIYNSMEIMMDIKKTADGKLAHIIFNSNLGILRPVYIDLDILCRDGTPESCSVALSSLYSDQNADSESLWTSRKGSESNPHDQHETGKSCIPYSPGHLVTASLQQETVMGRQVLVVDIVITEDDTSTTSQQGDISEVPII